MRLYICLACLLFRVPGFVKHLFVVDYANSLSRVEKHKKIGSELQKASKNVRSLQPGG